MLNMQIRSSCFKEIVTFAKFYCRINRSLYKSKRNICFGDTSFELMPNLKRLLYIYIYIYIYIYKSKSKVGDHSRG